MRAEDLRAVLLVKAVEEADRAGTVLTPADRASAARAARREHPESNDPHTLLAARAHRLLERLAKRERAVARALALARGSRWIGFALVGVAAVSGFALSALDGTQRINILGFSVLGLVLWNLAAYALLIMRPSLSGRRLPPFGRLRKAEGPLAEALAAFLREWHQAARPLYLARASRVLHLAALALALGLIGGLYLRGLVLEYQAVWASTFLDASQVHKVLSVVYGPASLLTGVLIPGVEELDAIRARGENAARWIHLMAATVVVFVVIPRTVLAVVASVALAKRRRRLEPPGSLLPYFRSVFSEAAGRATVCVMPYAYEPLPQAYERLRALLPQLLGGELAIELEASTPYGEEDALLAQLDVRGGGGADVLVLLFSLAATPEDENHGTLVAGARDLLARHRPRAELVAMVDEAPYAARLAAAGGARQRLTERRSLWQGFARAHGVEARLVDLGAAASAIDT
jgi:hypothetical protein